MTNFLAKIFSLYMVKKISCISGKILSTTYVPKMIEFVSMKYCIMVEDFFYNNTFTKMAPLSPTMVKSENFMLESELPKIPE